MNYYTKMMNQPTKRPNYLDELSHWNIHLFHMVKGIEEIQAYTEI